jgi:hypothetical protein
MRKEGTKNAHLSYYITALSVQATSYTASSVAPGRNFRPLSFAFEMAMMTRRRDGDVGSPEPFDPRATRLIWTTLGVDGVFDDFTTRDFFWMTRLHASLHM